MHKFLNLITICILVIVAWGTRPVLSFSSWRELHENVSIGIPILLFKANVTRHMTPIFGVHEEPELAPFPLRRSAALTNELKRETFIQTSTPKCSANSVHSSMCESDDEYDDTIKEKFNKALKNMKMDKNNLNEFFNNLMTDNGDSVLESRFGVSNDVTEDPVCPAMERVIYPQRGMTRSNNWVFLLNQDTMRQGVKVEECLNSSKLRSFFSDSHSCSFTPDDQESVCRQKYIFRKMIAMDDTGSDMVIESILIPSCCVCRRRALSSRFGGHSRNEIENSSTEIFESETDPTPRRISRLSPENSEIRFPVNE